MQSQSGRKRIMAPNSGHEWEQAPSTTSNALIRALGRAHRWQRLLDDGTYATIAELCRAEKITDAYVSRIMKFAMLAPDIVEEILDGKVDPQLTLTAVGQVPLLWTGQRKQFANRVR